VTTHTPHPSDRGDELRIDHALFGLDDGERAELARIGTTLGADAIDEFDLAAGAAAAAMVAAEASAPMPESAARRARMAASAWEASRAGRAEPARSAPRSSVTASLGWLAAAACLALAAGVWFNQPPATSPARQRQQVVTQRDELVRSATDLVRIPWTATEDRAAAAGVTGEVIWSDDRNEGYMVIKGLAANDPSVEQYQLWVFDAQRDERHPVDGGVFDIPAGAEEIIIPIDVRVPVSNATLFAVTVEKPGGVVVSSRERLPILAQVPKG